MAKQIKFVAACGTGMKAAKQIKEKVETEMSKRNHDVLVDAFMVKDITRELLSKYDGYLTIAKADLPFTPEIPVVDAGAVLYGIDAMAKPVYDNIETIITNLK